MASVAGRLSVIGWRLPGIFERFGRVTRVAGGARRSAAGLRSRVRLRAAPNPSSPYLAATSWPFRPLHRACPCDRRRGRRPGDPRLRRRARIF